MGEPGARSGPRDATRRRAASLIVLVLAGLAVAGTSASPPPPPLATAQASGTLEVTHDRPIASVVVDMDANAAARAIAGGRLLVRVVAGEGTITVRPTIVIVEPLDDANAQPSWGPSVNLTGSLDEGCAQPTICSARFRITAVLRDPDAKQASVAWQASVELHADGSSRPSAAPAGAHLDVTAGDPATRPAAELARSTLAPETVHLDADHPLASRFLELQHPAGGTGVGTDLTWLAFLTVDDPLGVTTSAPIGVRLVEPAQRGSIVGPVWGTTGFGVPACTEPAGCTTALRLDLSAPAGDARIVRDVGWSVALVGFGAPGAKPPAPLAVRLTDSFDLGSKPPSRSASDLGSFDVRKGANGSRVATIVLDASQVAQGSGPIDGFLQVQYEVRAAATTGAKPLNLGVGDYGRGDGYVPSSFGEVEPGVSTTLATALLPVTCSGRTQCAFQVPYFAIAPNEGPAVHVEWTLTAAWFADRNAPVTDALRLTLGTQPSIAPSARP